MTDHTHGDWGPCPPGELGRLGAWLRFRRRLRAATAAGLALLAVGGTSWLAYAAWSDAARKRCKDPEHDKPPPDPLRPDGPAGVRK